MGTTELRLPAIQVRQGPKRVIYQFAVDGKQLERFATVSRIHRNDEREVRGYQRPEALAHIAAIRKYLESHDPMIPNALVVAFDQRVRFVPTDHDSTVDYAQAGTLVIPIDDDLDPEDRPGWIVDGQQRTAAIREARIDCFPIPISAFITGNEEEQREQFILVNSAKPLPKSLIYELLPSTDALLPGHLARRRLSAQLLDLLNHDDESPFYRRIQTPTNPDGVIKDNSVLRMLDNSITDGVLYRFRNPATGDGDADKMTKVVNNYWTAVTHLFPVDWELKPRRSRLVHGVGIVSLGYLMDAIADRHFDDEIPSVELFEGQLGLIAGFCRWSTGEWDFGRGVTRRWNELQNTPRDVQLLTSHLLGLYRMVSRT